MLLSSYLLLNYSVAVVFYFDQPKYSISSQNMYLEYFNESDNQFKRPTAQVFS